MAGASTEMKSAFEGLMIAISEDILQVLTMLIDKVTPLIQKFASAPKPIKLIVIGIAALAAIMGPILLIIGMLIPGITALTTGIGVMSAAFGALNLSMGVVLLVVVGIAAAIAAIIIVWKNWDKVVAIFNKTIEVVKRTFATVSQAVFDLFNSKWGWLLPGGILFKAIVGLKKHWKDIWAAIRILAIVAWEKISGKFVEHFGWMLPGGAIHNALTRVKKKFDTTWNGIKAKFTVVSEFVKDLWDKHFGWMRPGGALFNALDSLKTKWNTVWKAIGAAMKGPVNAVIGGVNALLSAMNKISVGWEPKKLRGVTVVPGFEFKPFNFAQIPQLASGGIVKSPTLAMIGNVARRPAFRVGVAAEWGRLSISIF